MCKCTSVLKRPWLARPQMGARGKLSPHFSMWRSLLSYPSSIVSICFSEVSACSFTGALPAGCESRQVALSGDLTVSPYICLAHIPLSIRFYTSSVQMIFLQTHGKQYRISTNLLFSQKFEHHCST